ncbi:MAG: zf-HC2 domain-containing protein [Alysiella sp.]|uniref:anti-sigma factor family protein n=1 Tax=Alysiella sp. TaxID=1872483 RepID=UPI0026DBDBC9|nr:zf-HC2 domain-containing protein [Alysiella sp.]MDO4433780.1 zf-HC2 domain-containing protein [Alysiella sp.]
MKNCLNITRLISQAHDEKLAFKQRVLLNLHTMMCRKCRRYRQQIQMIEQAMRRLS